MKLKTYTTLFLTVLLFSCYRDPGVVQSYTVDKKEFNFNAKGGTETAHLLRWGRKKIRDNEIDWQYMGCYGQELPTTHKVAMQVDTLTDGTLRVSNEWVTFSSPQNRKTIKIETTENTTGKERVIYFHVASLAVGFTLTVKQDK